ncbi:MAG: LTA synthase family protein, partial [Eubacterium sp.]|nr:LTA synthase family protein [Eubacterium sp.]
MKISFNITRKRMILFGVFLAVAVAMFAITRYMLWTLLPYAGALFVIVNLDFELDDRLPWLWTGILFGLSCMFTEFCVQHVILSPDFYSRTSKATHWMNILLILAVYFFFQLILSRPSWSAIAAHCALTAFAYTNYFVYTVRGNEITYSDLITVGTGISVVKNYTFVLHDRGAYIIMMSILYVLLVRKIRVKYTWHWLQ